MTPLNLLDYWRQILMAVAAVAVVIWIANLDPFHSKQRLENRAVTAERQATINQAGIEALDTYAKNLTRNADRARKAEHAIQQAPGHDTPVPPDVLREWRNGLRDNDSEPPH